MICFPMHVVFTVYFDLCHANFMPAIRVFCPTEENKLSRTSFCSVRTMSFSLDNRAALEEPC